MAVKDNMVDEQNAYPCKHCKRHKMISFPKMFNIEGMLYARCTHCNNYNPYEFLGLTAKDAIFNWNDTMAHHDS